MVPIPLSFWIPGHTTASGKTASKKALVITSSAFSALGTYPKTRLALGEVSQSPAQYSDARVSGDKRSQRCSSAVAGWKRLKGGLRHRFIVALRSTLSVVFQLLLQARLGRACLRVLEYNDAIILKGRLRELHYCSSPQISQLLNLLKSSLNLRKRLLERWLTPPFKE